MGRTAYTEPRCLYKGALYLNFYLFLSLVSKNFIFGDFFHQVLLTVFYFLRNIKLY